MSVHVVYYKNGAKMLRPIVAREEYLALRNSERQRDIVSAVRAGDEKQKVRLVQMNYSCLPNEDGRLKGATRLSSTVGMDVDHVEAAELAPLKERILARREELGLLMLELSARGAGYHVVFRRRPELGHEENLQWASELLGVAFDKGAKDVTRVFFTTTASEEDLLFLDDEVFECKEVACVAKNEGTMATTGQSATVLQCYSSFSPLSKPRIIIQFIKNLIIRDFVD